MPTHSGPTACRKHVLVLSLHDTPEGMKTLRQVVRSLRSHPTPLDITVPAYRRDPIEIQKIGGVFSFPYTDIETLVGVIETIDLVLVIGDLTDPAPGGPDTLLTPRHAGLRYVEGVTWVAACLGIPVMLAGVCIEPPSRPEESQIVSNICAAAQDIIVRNRRSAQVLHPLGLPPDRVSVMALPRQWVDRSLQLLEHPSEALPPEARRPVLEVIQLRLEGRTQDRRPSYDMTPIRHVRAALTGPRRGDLVRIIAPQFFEPSGSQIIFGGAERYLVELVGVLRELGKEVEIVQRATGRGWERSAFGCPVFGIPARDFFDIESALYQSGTHLPALTIHLAFFTASRMTPPPAIGISHSVFWDQAFYQRPEVSPFHTARLMEALEYLDIIVANDANMINWLRTVSVRLADKCVRIPNFVDIERFFPAERKSDRIVVLFPRRLAADRGFWLMAAIIPDLVRCHPEVVVELVGIAAGEDERREAERLTTRFPQHVRWSVMPFDQMPDVYRSADIVVIPPLCSEGTSLSCLEAMASGKAVVATRVGGLPELIINEYNGLLVDPTTSALRNAIERLIIDSNLRTQLGYRAAETARCFHIARWREQWRDLLKTFVS